MQTERQININKEDRERLKYSSRVDPKDVPPDGFEAGYTLVSLEMLYAGRRPAGRSSSASWE